MSHYPERRHPRFEFLPLPLVFSLHMAEPAPIDKPLRLEAKNISEGGMKFVCNRRFRLFERIELGFFEKTGGKALSPLHGKVVRVEEVDTGYGERTYGIALEFVTGRGLEELAARLPSSPPPPK